MSKVYCNPWCVLYSAGNPWCVLYSAGMVFVCICMHAN